MAELGFSVNRKILRPSPDLVSIVSNFSTANVADIMGKSVCMNSHIKPIAADMRVVGPAVTVKLHPGDNLMAHIGIDVAQPGDVLVIDNRGNEDFGPFGELMGLAAQAKGIAGLVIDGMIRDIAALRRMGFPVFARGSSPNGTNKEGPGEVNSLISCGGVPVNPGDLVIGDDDGVVVIPKEKLPGVIKAVQKKIASEKVRRKEIAEGVFVRPNLLKIIKEKGVE